MQSLKNILKKITPVEIFIVVLIMVLLITFSVFLVHNIEMAKKSGVFTQRKSVYEMLIDHKKLNQTTVADIEYIDTWMTFQYINFVFNIPEDYLRDTFRIEDVRYPNMTLGRYVKDQKIDKIQFIVEMKKIARDFMNLHPVK
ncbi:MAG: hypothetical protein Q8K26_01200 [Candidatus Gracilibacteria bacterium]|nr:hypothetical protein [Candidatus Gracilibacteria bacterium]